MLTVSTVHMIVVYPDMRVVESGHQMVGCAGQSIDSCTDG